jgi:hypothetical protein
MRLRRETEDLVSVYVDEVRVYGPTRIRCFQHGSAHLTADVESELHDFADKLGLRRAWFQASPPSSHPHYDLTPSKQKLALKLGAKLVPAREQAKRRIAARRKERPCSCDADISQVHDDVSSWCECRACKAIWDLRSELPKPPIATRLRDRCRSTEVAIDGPVPRTERCVFVKKHAGRHECIHGFHWR